MRSTGPRPAAALAVLAFAALAAPLAAQPQAPPAAASPAGDYVLDPDRSSLRISLGGPLGMAVVRFTRLDGGFVYPQGASAPTQVRMNVDTTSASGAPWTRRAAISALDVQQFPRATFVADSIEKVGDDDWSMAGRLTLRGVTRPLTLDVSLATPPSTAAGEPRVRVVGAGQISRSAYGVPAPALASDRMDLHFDAEFVRRPTD